MSKANQVKPINSGTVITQKKKVSSIKPFISKSSKQPFGSSKSSINKTKNILPKKRSLNLFDEEYDDNNDNINNIPPKKKFLNIFEDNNEEINKQKQQETMLVDTTNDIDPLDAFMNNINNVKDSNNNKGIRNDIEEDDYDSFIIQQGNKIKPKLDNDNEYDDYDSNDEDYLDTMRADNNKQKKFIEPLPVVYHSEISYPSFKKNFYLEHPDITKLSLIEVNEYRKSINVQVTGLAPKPCKSFKHLGLGEKILKVIEKQNFIEPTPIQKQSIPTILSGYDVIGIAKTGSGKTAAFVWPMLIHIRAQPPLRKGDGPIGIIVAPTRELAQQIYIETKKYAKKYKLRVCPIYGGVPKAEQVKDLKKGVEILVCTPGRLIDIIKMKKITNMRRVTYLVFDEADKMFNMGFEIQVRSIAGQIRPDRQTLLFSATFKKKVENVARDILTNPIRISVGTVGEANADVNQRVHVIKDESEKWTWLVERLSIFQRSGSILIFVGTKNASEELSNNLNLAGFSSLAIHGDKLQHERDEIMRKYKTQSIPILVATDVIARGLDIKSIQTVVNFDVAKDIESHIHRIGRTCRAGNKDGVAYTLIGPKNNVFAGFLINNLKSAKQPIPPELITLAETNPKYKSNNNNKPIRGQFRGRGKSNPILRVSNTRINSGKGIGFQSNINRKPSTSIHFQRASDNE